MSDRAEDVTGAEKLAWLRARQLRDQVLPNGPRTAEQWRGLILSQITADPTCSSPLYVEGRRVMVNEENYSSLPPPKPGDSFGNTDTKLTRVKCP